MNGSWRKEKLEVCRLFEKGNGRQSCRWLSAASGVVPASSVLCPLHILLSLHLHPHPSRRQSHATITRGLDFSLLIPALYLVFLGPTERKSTSWLSRITNMDGIEDTSRYLSIALTMHLHLSATEHAYWRNHRKVTF